MTRSADARPASARAGQDLRVALIGYGLAGAVFHAPLVAATPGLRLASVVTANAERAAQAKREHPGARVLSSPDELWVAGGDHELVVVATPNRTHAPLAAAALDAGLAVVVDKPLAASAAEARGLAELAQHRDAMLAVFHNRRWDGDLLTLRRLLGEGALGDPLRFESRFERWRPQLKEGAWRELSAPEEAGGVLFDLGSHLIDQALLLLGPIASVYAEVDVRRPGAQVDDDSFVALAHRSGARSHLWMSQTAAHQGPRMRMLGSRAAYVKWGLDVQEDQLRAGVRPGDLGWGREREEAWGMVVAGGDRRRVSTEAGAYERFYVDVAAALRDGAPPPVTAEDGVEVLAVIDAAFESARSGSAVSLA